MNVEEHTSPRFARLRTRAIVQGSTALVLLGALGVAPVCSAGDDAQRAAAERFAAYLKQFPESDVNGDGRLSQDEWFSHYSKRDKAAFVQERDARLRLVEDVTYADIDGRPLKLDLYLPKLNPRSPSAKPALVVWIHGGGWHSGGKDWSHVRWLTDEGYALASIQYRLSGEAPFPAQIHDCKGAIRWLRAHAADYGYDPNRIAVTGESAGGHLAALIGTSNGVDALEGNVGGHTDQSSRVRAVVDFYGPTDLVKWFDERGSIDAIDRLFGKPAGQARDSLRLASPASHITPDDPPILILHGSQDPLVPVDQSQHLHRLYEAAGLVSQIHVVEGAKHTGPQFSDATRRQIITAFLRRHLSETSTGNP